MPLLATTPTHRPSFDRAATLRKYLCAYWLRPENALWMTLRSEALAKCRFAAPCVDVCCGDGLFTFLHCGGELDPAFDVFTSVNVDPSREHRITDMFDCSPDAYRPNVLRPAVTQFDAGLDHKKNLLAKARRLNFYSRLIHHDGNDPLPFPDASINFLYCNSAYWFTDVEAFLLQIARTLTPTGRAVLHVKLDSMRDFNLERFEHALGRKFLDLMAGDRLKCWPTLANRKTWEDRFRRAGLEIIDEAPIATAMHAHLWDIGLRPLAPLLIRMTSALTPQTRASIKVDWVETLLPLLEPFCDPGLNLSIQGSPSRASASAFCASARGSTSPANSPEPAELQYVLASK